MAKLLQGLPYVFPVNLLPNSTFQGIDRTNIRHFDHTDNNVYNIIYSCGFGTGMTQVYFRSVYSTMSKVDITISDGSIRIQGNVTRVNNQYSPAIWINIKYNIPNGKIMTVGCRCKNRKNITTSCPIIENAHNVYYKTLFDKSKFNTSEPVDSKQIMMATNQSSAGGLVYQMHPRPLAVGETIPIDITLYDFYMYEGAYINPPVTNSLDVNPRPLFLKSDLSNFPSNVSVFNFEQRNSRDNASLSYKTFLANKYYNLLRIATNDALTSIATDGIEYINIRGVVSYPDTTQLEACAYELKIFWHEVSQSSYKGAYSIFIETPTIKVNTVQTFANRTNIAGFRLRKSSIKIYDLQWQVSNINNTYVQQWTMEVDVYGKVVNRLSFIPWDNKYNGSDYFTPYD